MDCSTPGLPGAYSNPCPLSRWCHRTISSSVVPFFSCLQSLLASRYFPMSQFFTSGDQSIGSSASATVLLLVNIWWFSLGLTNLISFQFKELFKSLLQHHNSKASFLQHSVFFMAQLPYQYKTTGKTIALTIWTFVSKVMSLLFNMQ